MTTPETRTFRIAFWRIYPPMLVYSQAVYWAVMSTLLLADAVVFGHPITLGVHGPSLIGGSVAVTALLAPAFWLTILALPVRLSPDGFTCSNAYGKLLTVPWGSITAVRPVHIPGLPYLLVTSTAARGRLWLLLLLRRETEFADEVERLAGPAHPLFHALWPRVRRSH